MRAQQQWPQPQLVEAMYGDMPSPDFALKSGISGRETSAVGSSERRDLPSK
jgi:hypothetical protein